MMLMPAHLVDEKAMTSLNTIKYKITLSFYYRSYLKFKKYMEALYLKTTNCDQIFYLAIL